MSLDGLGREMYKVFLNEAESMGIVVVVMAGDRGRNSHSDETVRFIWVDHLTGWAY